MVRSPSFAILSMELLSRIVFVVFGGRFSDILIRPPSLLDDAPPALPAVPPRFFCLLGKEERLLLLLPVPPPHNRFLNRSYSTSFFLIFAW